MFSDAFGADHQLIKCEPKREMYLACALMVRGGVHLSDIRRNIDRFANDFLCSELILVILSESCKIEKKKLLHVKRKAEFMLSA